MDTSASRHLAELLWKAYKAAGSGSTGPVVVRQLLAPEVAESLDRPWTNAGEGFIVALADGPRLTRFADPEEATAANAGQARTRLYESVHARPGHWPALVASHLASWLDADVLSSVYEAEASDAGLPEHHDAWDNIVLQIEGTKRWVLGGGEVVVLAPGDVFVVPTGVIHYVRTPTRSVHINFEVINPAVVAAYLRDSIPVDASTG